MARVQKTLALATVLFGGAAAGEAVPRAITCSGTADPPGLGCYVGSAGALGVKETVKVSLKSYAGGHGTVDVVASGASALSCSGRSFTKTGQEIAVDWQGCLPSNVQISSVEYCSDSDSIKLTAKDTKLPLPAISTLLTKASCEAEPEVEAVTCTGAADPPGLGCYSGSAGALGVKESVTVSLKSYAAGHGTVDVAASGVRALSCPGKSFSKSGQDIAVDWSGCLPAAVEVTSVQYCSDSDSIKITAKDDKLPLPSVTTLLKKTACAANEVGVTCTGAADPPGLGCYEGSAGALGVTETVKVALKSYSAGQGIADITASGATGLSCTGKSFSKSGQAVNVDWSGCLPSSVEITSVEYCSDSDTIKISAKDSKLPLPAITTALSKVACAAEVIV